MRDVLFGALAQCKVINGIVQFDDIASDEEFKKFSVRVRHDLLAGQIPHYRAVGLYVRSREITSTLNVLSKMRSVGRSYAELMPAVSKLVFAEGYGTDAGLQEDSTLGVLYGTKEVTSSNGSLKWNQEWNRSVESLIYNQEICTLGPDCSISILLKRGTGEREYYENERLIRNTNFKPLRTLYDLNDYLLLHLYETQSRRLHFIYKTKINDKVLEKILQEYAKEINFENSLRVEESVNAGEN